MRKVKRSGNNRVDSAGAANNSVITGIQYIAQLGRSDLVSAAIEQTDISG